MEASSRPESSIEFQSSLPVLFLKLPLRYSFSAGNQIKDQDYEGRDQQNVNEPSGSIGRDHSQQPKDA